MAIGRIGVADDINADAVLQRDVRASQRVCQTGADLAGRDRCCGERLVCRVVDMDRQHDAAMLEGQQRLRRAETPLEYLV